MDLEICSGCVVRNFGDENLNSLETKKQFLEKLEAAFKQSNTECKISWLSCQRFCPEDRLSLVRNGRLEMVKAMPPEEIAANLRARS